MMCAGRTVAVIGDDAGLQVAIHSRGHACLVIPSGIRAGHFIAVSID
jgi:hypothetical protein